jgi:hypothetical protein
MTVKINFIIINTFLAILLGAIGIPILGMNVKMCWGVENNGVSETISLAAKEKPLKEVFRQITKATGYDIRVNPEWETFPVSVRTECDSAETCLKRILGSIKNLNYAIISQEKKKTIWIFVKMDGIATSAYAASIADNPARPPKMLEKPQTFEDYLKNADPKLIEVIPPKNSGEKGVTLDQMRSFALETEKIDPKVAEVIPPLQPGKKGVTLESMQALKASQKNINHKDSEAIPPTISGEKGITVGELEALKTAFENKGNLDSDSAVKK